MAKEKCRVCSRESEPFGSHHMSLNLEMEIWFLCGFRDCGGFIRSEVVTKDDGFDHLFESEASQLDA